MSQIQSRLAARLSRNFRWLVRPRPAGLAVLMQSYCRMPRSGEFLLVSAKATGLKTRM